MCFQPVAPSIRKATFLREVTGKYEFQYENVPAKKKKKPLIPKIGDVVRYYDLDGGKEDGEVLVGKISFIQKKMGDETTWIAELSELEDVGDGYYSEYGFMKRQSKKALRDLDKISPISASFVRNENAFKVPREAGTLKPMVRAEQYDLEDYEGPLSQLTIDQDVIQADGEVYAALKLELIRNAAVVGAAGALVVDLVKGFEDAAIFAAGAAAGVAYLFFLGVKTDTVGTSDSKMGSNISSVRFFVPLMVLTGVAIYNKSLGSQSPVLDGGVFTSVTPEQFASAIVGFLTYRIPLFFYQIKELLGEDDNGTIPGSAGIAMKLAQKEVDDQLATSASDGLEGLTPVLLVSGPEAAGRSQLVQQLVEESDGRFVTPNLMDRVQDGAAFERAETRGEFLEVDSSGRYGLTKDAVINTGTKGESVVVIDASVDLTKELLKIGDARLIGVWVGLDSVEKYQDRIEQRLESGVLAIPENTSKGDYMRSKVKEIVTDIEFGLVSGIFEFTILNDDPAIGVEELKAASEYCFK